MLAIHFLSSPDDEATSVSAAGPGWARGRITIDDFAEDFESPLWFWKKPDYEQQWLDGIARIVNGATKSCIITSLIEPIRSADYVFGAWWKLYREGESVILQQQLMIGEVVGAHFDVADPYAAIPDYQPTTPEGETLSSWTTSFAGLSLRGLQ
jgi:hypothetical protein